MDIVDKAKEREQEQRNKAIAAVIAQTTKQGSIDCIDCDEDIPLARRHAYPAATRCITCQKIFEKKDGAY